MLGDTGYSGKLKKKMNKGEGKEGKGKRGGRKKGRKGGKKLKRE